MRSVETKRPLQKFAEFLDQVADPPEGEWCVTRWLEDKLCGPVSRMRFDHEPRSSAECGFPDGYMVLVELFPSFEKAKSFTKWSEGRAVDIPTPLTMLSFRAEVYDREDGSVHVLYDGGEYRRALFAAAAFTGWCQKLDSRGYHEARVVCEPRTEFEEFLKSGRTLEERVARSPHLLMDFVYGDGHCPVCGRHYDEHARDEREEHIKESGG